MRAFLLLLFLLPHTAIAGAGEDFTSLARDLMQADQTDDGELLGNTLSKLKAQACKGSAKASALLGRKYLSGQDEFQADHLRSRQYLSYAASRGEGTAATDLVMQLAAGGSDALLEARKWVLVASYSQGQDSVLVRMAENAVDLASREEGGAPERAKEPAADAALIIHYIRNGLANPDFAPPCQL